MIVNSKTEKRRNFLQIEFNNAIKCFIIWNKVFCSAPVNLEFVSPSKQVFEKTSSSKKNIKLTLHLVWSLLVICCVTTSTYYQNTEADGSIAFLSRMLYIAEYALGGVNLILIVVGCQYQKKYYLIFFNKFLEVDLNLDKIGLHTNFLKIKRFLNRTLISYSTFFIIVLLIDFLYNKMNIPSFFRSSTVYTLPNVVSLMAVTQYSVGLEIICLKLKMINEYLMKLGRRGFKYQNANVISLLTTDFKMYVDHAKIMNTIRMAHSQLLRLMDDLNESFGILIITTLLASYIILSTQFYAFYTFYEGFVENDFSLAIYTFLWIILHGTKIIIIIYSVHNVIDQRNDTGLLLYELKINYKDTETFNLEV